MKFDTNDIITKSNDLIEAKYKLGVTEQKIILFLVSKIQPNDDEFRTYTFSVKEFAKIVGLKGNSYQAELRRITLDMMKKPFELHINNKIVQVNWLSYVAYHQGKGNIDLQFHPVLKPYFLKLKNRFTSYKLGNVVKLKSSYSIRLYEQLKQYEMLKERIFEVDELKDKLGATEAYPAYGNFKQRVIVPAQKELEEKTDISFEFDEIRVGRRVEKIRFSIKSQTHETEPVFLPSTEDIDEVMLLLNQLKIKVSERTLNKWKKDYGEQEVINAVKQIEGKTHINKPVAYISGILKKRKENTENTSAVEQVEMQFSSPIDDFIQDFKKRYQTSTETPIDWVLKADFIKKAMDKLSCSQEEAQGHWEAQKQGILNYLSEQVDNNRKRKRA